MQVPEQISDVVVLASANHTTCSTNWSCQVVMVSQVQGRFTSSSQEMDRAYSTAPGTHTKPRSQKLREVWAVKINFVHEIPTSCSDCVCTVKRRSQIGWTGETTNSFENTEKWVNVTPEKFTLISSAATNQLLNFTFAAFTFSSNSSCNILCHSTRSQFPCDVTWCKSLFVMASCAIWEWSTSSVTMPV